MKNPVDKQDTRPGEIARLLHLCGLGLDGEVPDHSTLCKIRHGRFRDSDLLRRLFETVLQRCIDEGLVGGQGFAVDASLIQVDASDRTRVEVPRVCRRMRRAAPSMNISRSSMTPRS